jgi:hypothetical protein
LSASAWQQPERAVQFYAADGGSLMFSRDTHGDDRETTRTVPVSMRSTENRGSGRRAAHRARGRRVEIARLV